MIQYLVVGVIVLCALLYVGAKYLPKGWRTAIVYKLTKRGAAQDKLVQWLDTSSSCGSGCDTCGTCADTPAQPEQQPENGRRVIKLHVQK